MKNFKKIALASVVFASLSTAAAANACVVSDVLGMQLKPMMADAFKTPNTGVSFGGHQFKVAAPANCYDSKQGYQTCKVLLDHLGVFNGYYLVVDQTIHPKTKQVVTQVSAYPDHIKVLLTYTQPYMPGSALNVVDVKRIGE